MTRESINDVIAVWQQEFSTLSADPRINHVQIFENKGSMMGNSNPHPHCQIWAQESIPEEPKKEGKQLKAYYARTKKSLLSAYIALEMKLGERVVYSNDSFLVVVPFWAVWPF